MSMIEALPFRGEVQPTTSLADASFRYQPNVLCPACRELLQRGLALQAEYGRRLAKALDAKFKFGDLVESAELGCHLCALFTTTMLGVARHQPIPEPSYDVQFTVQRTSNSDALYQIALFCSPGPNSGITRGYIQVYPRDRATTINSDLPVTEFSQLSLGRNTGDHETFGVARAWLDKCLRGHSLCAENDDEARVVRPARLLYLENTIKLVDSSEARGQQYVTLSHCWGKKKIPRLLFDTEAELRAGVGLDYLPKTFQDAVAITRELGYKYIWIDSLCIIQDSRQDWEIQAKIMALVYVNSVFTIAALKSPGSYGGCFTTERNSLALRPLDLPDLGIGVARHISGELWDTEVDPSGYGASPLHTRSWVVQERLSSPRTLLYGAHGVYWECRCAQASESHYREVAWDDSRNKKTWLQKLEAAWDVPSEEAALRPNPWISHWIGLLRDYSSCELTEKTDKIIAVTGLISEIARRSKTHTRCVLGLWADDLPGMLLWYRARNDMNTPTDEIGRLSNGMPSWTWASVEGTCSYMHAAGTVEWQTTTELDEATKPETVAISTWRRKVVLDEDNALVFDPDDPKTRQKRLRNYLDESFSWFPDCEMPAESQELFVAVINQWRLADNPPLRVARCIVVTPSPSAQEGAAPNEFTRVGMAILRFRDARDDPFKSNDSEPREVMVLR